ncbi:hypothetical protein, partial [Helicobacter pylori]|uniref:hypothetical protein n=1 Tax=Helicobacter pylori TaxID=210 RepID=UPI000EB047B1
LLKGLKIVTSGPSVKERTSTPKESKESRFKLDFEFFGKDEETSGFLSVASLYANTERKRRLSSLFVPMVFEGQGFQASMIIIHALTCASKLKRHSDAEWSKMIESRNTDDCNYDTFDYMDRVATTLFCGVIKAYAEGREEFNAEFNDFSPNGFWATTLPKNKNEALFIAQLLCDGGINKYSLSCAGLTENLLKDIYNYIGLANAEEIDEYIDNLDKEEVENLEN